MKIKNIAAMLAMAFAVAMMPSCSKTKSYTELLNEEEHAANWFLAQYNVIPYAPADSVFITGENAPYYRMDQDGNVYMRVIVAGDKKNRPKEGDRVYFSFMRRDIKQLSQGVDVPWLGNAENPSSLGSTSFLLGNELLQSSTQYGDGIQLPMYWLGYYSEVELVVKSLEGFSTDMNNCTPYVYKIRYFPAEY